MSVTAAAIGAAILLLAIAAFQAALALGAPLGAYALGGRHEGVLPDRLRTLSAVNVAILIAMALMVLIRVGILYPRWAPAMEWPVWAIFLFLITNVFGNLASKSRKERVIMTPLAGLAAAFVLVVALY